jgi:hypothetical protein
MKQTLQVIFDELQKKAFNVFRMTGSIPIQSIAITNTMMRISFDRGRGHIPAGALGVAKKGYVSAPHAIRQGLILAVYMSNFGYVDKHELFDIKPDYLHIDCKNFVWFELNSRVITIREAYYIDHNETPPEPVLIPRSKFDQVVENEVEDLFSLNS